MQVEAEKMQVEVMETRRRVLGEEHPDTLTSMKNLTLTIKRQNKNMEAVKFMECVRLRNQVLGPACSHSVSSSAALTK